MKWPAIIRCWHDVELIYVGDETEWHNNVDLYSVEYDEKDCLIDSSGNIFGLSNGKNGRADPEPRGTSMALHELLGLIKAHAAQQGSCCVAKLYAPTITQAFEIVKSLNER